MWVDPNSGAVFSRKPNKGLHYGVDAFRLHTDKPETAPKERTQRIIDEVQATSDPFTIIAKRHGVSRERVRQVAKTYCGLIGRNRMKAATAERRKEKRQNMGFTRTHCSLSRFVRRWLAEIGYGYCGTCFSALPLQEMTAPGRIRCKPCVAAKTRKWWRSLTPEARKAWAKKNNDRSNAKRKAKSHA